MGIFKSRTIAASALLSLGLLAGCAHQADAGMSQHGAAGQATETSATKAADLRVALNKLLGEHVVLAADATGAALGGRSAEFQAAAAALDQNSVDIASAVGSVYGADAGKAFLPLWRTHIGFVVDYTQGVANNDKGAQEKAVGNLLQYANDFGAFINSASPALPKDAVAELVKQHAVTLKAVIDAQAAGDQQKAYTAQRAAYGHMSHIADALADAIVKQFPERF
jgi:hypothetical protein